MALTEFDAAAVRTIVREVGLLAQVNHPNVLRFFGYCRQPPSTVTELCTRGSLYDVLHRARSDDTAAAELTWRRRLRLALGAAKGMHHLHSHHPPILHRDLRSPNLFVDEQWTAKVGGLGLSEAVPAISASEQTMLPSNGGFSWLAPEVLLDPRAATAESDVFSFGIVLRELLTGTEPWDKLVSALPS